MVHHKAPCSFSIPIEIVMNQYWKYVIFSNAAVAEYAKQEPRLAEKGPICFILLPVTVAPYFTYTPLIEPGESP